MRHFGTDGIRALESVFTDEYLTKIALGITTLGEKMKIAIGRDPRMSGARIADRLTEVLTSHGVEVIDLGMVPTPTTAYLTKYLKCDYGVMLSASHNPPEYNGVKLFSCDGEKVSEEVELKVEEYIDRPYGIPLSKAEFHYFDGAEVYINYVLNALKPDFRGMKVLLDTANGATSIIAPEIFRRAGATVTQLKSETDGYNINKGCGATVPQFLLEEMKKGNYSIGFTYDGDGDRVMCVSNGKIFNGDHLMYVNSLDMKAKGELVDNVMVGTVMSNYGTELACNKAGLTLIRTGVGDKLVFREMKAHGYNVGGEESGHIIFTDYLRTGDGMIASVITAKLNKEKPIFLADNIEEYPSVSDCIVCDKKGVEKFKNDNEIKEFLANIDKKYRTVIRPSGTEPKIRILVEAKEMSDAKQCADNIKTFINGRII